MAAAKEPKARQQRPKAAAGGSPIGVHVLLQMGGSRVPRQCCFLYKKQKAAACVTFRKWVTLLPGFAHFTVENRAQLVPRKCPPAPAVRPKWLPGRSPQPVPPPSLAPCSHACAEGVDLEKNAVGPNVDQLVTSAYCQVSWTCSGKKRCGRTQLPRRKR